MSGTVDVDTEPTHRVTSSASAASPVRTAKGSSAGRAAAICEASSRLSSTSSMKRILQPAASFTALVSEIPAVSLTASVRELP
jgi:hypothetical protein